MDRWARYLTPLPAHRALGVVCLGAGVQPGERVRRRTLGCWALVVLDGGGGTLDAGGERHEPSAPGVFWLPPGVPHSYAPGPEGWTESWVLFDGPALPAWSALGYLPDGPAAAPLGDPAPVRRAFAGLAAVCRGGDPDPHAAAAVAVQGLFTAVREAARTAVPDVLRALRRDAFRPWPMAEHARRLGMSESALRRAVRAAAGCSPKEFLLGVRIEHAQELLADSDATVAAVARRAGYEDPAYFARLFARRTGRSPSAFRESRRRG